MCYSHWMDENTEALWHQVLGRQLVIKTRVKSRLWLPALSIPKGRVASTAPCNFVFPEKSYFFSRISVDSRQIIRWLVRHNLRSFQQGLCPRVTLLTSSYRAQNATSACICWALRKNFPSERQWYPEVVYPKQKLDFRQEEDLEAGIIGHVWTPSGKNRV